MADNQIWEKDEIVTEVEIIGHVMFCTLSFNETDEMSLVLLGDSDICAKRKISVIIKTKCDKILLKPKV
jgi:hypothetical protein